MTGRALVFANGELTDPQRVKQFVLPEDYLIAVDGGLYHLRRMGLEPHLLVGDMDSLAAEDLAAVQQSGCEVRRFAVEKDETDLELALQIAVEKGFTSVRILAALGGRLDQMLANLFLLTNPTWQEVDLRLVDAGVEAFIIRQETVIEGCQGDTVSLLPLNGPAYGVTTEDLAYPLKGETLWPDRSRGVSNRMLEQRAQVSVEKGLLLCVHLHQDLEFSLPENGHGSGGSK